MRDNLINSDYEVVVNSGSLSFFQITNIIDSGSPIIICEEAEYAIHPDIQHAVLIQGYAYEDNNPLHILVTDDPTNSATKLEDYNNVRFNGYIYFKKRS